jgi:hypothetical protein
MKEETFGKRIAEVIAKDLFQELQPRGYKKPRCKASGWVSHVLTDNGWLGIDFEIDERDQCVCVLICKLSEGKWPDGYYCDSKGNVCRVHVQKILRFPPVRKMKRRRNDDVEQLRAEAFQELSLVTSRIEEIEIRAKEYFSIT